MGEIQSIEDWEKSNGLEPTKKTYNQRHFPTIFDYEEDDEELSEELSDELVEEE